MTDPDKVPYEKLEEQLAHLQRENCRLQAQLVPLREQLDNLQEAVDDFLSAWNCEIVEQVTSLQLARRM